MHLTATQCADAVRGTLSGEERELVHEHASECPECTDLLRFWARVREFAEADGTFEPPADAVAAAKAYAAQLPAAEPGMVSRAVGHLKALIPVLAFDTFEHALPAGARAGASSVRQLVYQIPPMSIDLRLEKAGRADRIILAGQIASAADQRGSCARVAIVDGLTELALVIANDFGEFHCEFEPTDDMILSISLADGTDISIPLDRLPTD